MLHHAWDSVSRGNRSYMPVYHKEREKFLLWHLAAALCFSDSEGPFERWKNTKTEGLREGVSKAREPRVSVQCPVFQAHPKLILHLVRFPWSSTSFSPQPSVLSHTISLRLTQEAKHGYTHPVSRGSCEHFFHHGALQFVYHVGALWKQRSVIINNIFWPGKPLFGLSFILSAALLFHVWPQCESPRSSSGL